MCVELPLSLKAVTHILSIIYLWRVTLVMPKEFKVC